MPPTPDKTDGLLEVTIYTDAEPCTWSTKPSEKFPPTADGLMSDRYFESLVHHQLILATGESCK